MADRGRGTAVRGGGAMSAARGGGGAKSMTRTAQPTLEKPRREAILDLSKYVNEKIRVKFTGGREVMGILKGYDQLLNLVLDEVEEELTEPKPHKRVLGLVVLRGPTITLLSPVDGSRVIANPFAQPE